MPRALSHPWSLAATLVFWWGAFVIVQSAERLFLVATTLRQERPSAATLGKTLLTGFRTDLIGATAGILVAIALGVVIGGTVALLRRRRIRRGDVRPPWTRGIWAGGLV